MEIFQLLCSRRYCPVNIPQVNYSTISSQPPLQNPAASLSKLKSKSKSHCDWRSVSQSVSQYDGARDQIFITVWQFRSCCCGAPSLTRGRGCLFYMLLALPAQSFSGPSPFWLATIFYCLRFETPVFVASYDSQGHGGGIRSRLHTGTASLPHYSKCSGYNFSARTT
jgi:hypothetical protein